LVALAPLVAEAVHIQERRLMKQLLVESSSC